MILMLMSADVLRPAPGLDSEHMYMCIVMAVGGLVMHNDGNRVSMMVGSHKLDHLKDWL